MAVYYQMSYCQLLLIYMCNIHTVFLPICPLYHNNVLKKSTTSHRMAEVGQCLETPGGLCNRFAIKHGEPGIS